MRNRLLEKLELNPLGEVVKNEVPGRGQEIGGGITLEVYAAVINVAAVPGGTSTRNQTPSSRTAFQSWLDPPRIPNLLYRGLFVYSRMILHSRPATSHSFLKSAA